MKYLMNLPLRVLPIVIILILGFAIDIHLAYERRSIWNHSIVFILYETKRSPRSYKLL